MKQVDQADRRGHLGRSSTTGAAGSVPRRRRGNGALASSRSCGGRVATPAIATGERSLDASSSRRASSAIAARRRARPRTRSPGFRAAQCARARAGSSSTCRLTARRLRSSCCHDARLERTTDGHGARRRPTPCGDPRGSMPDAGSARASPASAVPTLRRGAGALRRTRARRQHRDQGRAAADGAAATATVAAALDRLAERRCRRILISSFLEDALAVARGEPAGDPARADRSAGRAAQTGARIVATARLRARSMPISAA